MFQLFEKVLSLYGNTLRRERELYILHPLRVAKRLEFLDFSLEVCTVGLLHDVLELDLNVTLDTLIIDFQLSQNQVEMLELLTRKVGESSSEHFERVLNSNNSSAIVIKYLDCSDNSEFYPEDFTFTKNVLGLDPVIEQRKYQDRAQLCVNKLKSLGVDLFDY